MIAECRRRHTDWSSHASIGNQQLPEMTTNCTDRPTNQHPTMKEKAKAVADPVSGIVKKNSTGFYFDILSEMDNQADLTDMDIGGDSTRFYEEQPSTLNVERDYGTASTTGSGVAKTKIQAIIHVSTPDLATRTRPILQHSQGALQRVKRRIETRR